MRDLCFDDMHLFARVAEPGTLSAVARERDVPVRQVSRALARIETACSARLIHRSTHGLTPTAEGQTFLQYCRRLTGTLDELEGEFASQSRQASGRVRVAACTVVPGCLLIPSFESLHARHPKPKLCVELTLWTSSLGTLCPGSGPAWTTGPAGLPTARCAGITP